MLDAVFLEISTFNLEKQVEAKKRINEEIMDGLCMCFTGRISRLINSLSGYSEKVSIKISENEEIGNIISNILNKNKNEQRELIIEKIKKELLERKYTEEIINEWIEYI